MANEKRRNACDGCTTSCEKRTAPPKTVPFAAHEAAMYRADRRLTRISVAFLVAIVLLFSTNMGWVIHCLQSEKASCTQDVASLNTSNVEGQGDETYEADIHDRTAAR